VAMRTLRVLVVVTVLMFPAALFGVPTLQLYIPGSTYDTVTETWIKTGSPFELYVAGSKSPSKVTYITDVTLWVSVFPQDYNLTGSVAIQGAAGEPANVLSISEVLGLGGDTPDPGSPGTPSGLQHDAFPAYYWSVDLPDLLFSATQYHSPGSRGSISI